MNKIKLAVIASVLTASGAAMAATDGTLGTLSSTGESIVSIIKQDGVLITKVTDITFPDASNLASDPTLSGNVCVFSSTGGYNVTVTSANGALNGGNFELNGATAATTVGYSVLWDATAIGYNVNRAGLTGDQISTDCAGGTNASFGVTLSSADFNAADPDTYTDTMNLIVAPE